MLRFQKIELKPAKEEELEIASQIFEYWLRKNRSTSSHYTCVWSTSTNFDSVPQDALWITMLDMGFRAHLVNLIMQLYKSHAKVKTSAVVTWWFSVMKEVRQNCVLSPHLVNILLEAVMRETLDGYTGGLRIGGRTVTN